jgi:hypothetical protein
MGRRARTRLIVLSAVGAIAVLVPSATAVAETTGTETMHGGLVKAKDRVVGTAIAASGVFNGVGRIVERPNRPGDSDKVTRDDLVFAEGLFHIVNVNRHVSFSVNRRTCVLSYKAQQTNRIEGGTGRFAHASGRFTATVTASAVAMRKPDGSCDMQRPPLVEIDIVGGTGRLSY